MLLRQHLWESQVPGLEVRDGPAAQMGGWGISVPAFPMPVYPRRCFFQGRDCFFLCVSENLREGLGGNSRDITPSNISQPAICGPQAVCQMSKGLQSGCRQFGGTNTSILTHARKGAKTTGSGSRRQSEGNMVQLSPPWGGPKVFIALSKKERSRNTRPV